MTPVDPDTLSASGHPGEWFVAFFDPPSSHWWDDLLAPGFRHCLAFGFCVQAQCWLIHDVTEARTYVCALTPSRFDDWLAALPPARIVRFRATAPRVPAFRFAFWCTTATAHLTGCVSRALRPQALYRDLIAQGARPAFEARDAKTQDRDAEGRPGGHSRA